MTEEDAFQLARDITDGAGSVGFTAAVAGAIYEAYCQGIEASSRICEKLADDQPTTYRETDREWEAAQSSAFNTAARAIRLHGSEDKMSRYPPPRCTCHPDDNPPVPCPQKHAYSECVKAALHDKDEEIRRLRDCIVAARWQLAKGRGLWNGPCHQCDAVLHKGLTTKEFADIGAAVKHT